VIAPGAAAVRRVLVIRLHHLGDVLLTTPAVRWLRAAFPAARIDYLTRGAGVDALRGNPRLDEVISYRAGLRGELALLRDLRERSYDAVIDFHCTPRSARVVFATGAHWRIGAQGRGPRNLVYSHLAPRERDSRVYMPRRFLHRLRPLGYDVSAEADLALEIAMGDAEREWAREAWERLALPVQGPVVALSAVARDPLKQWGTARWAAVADALEEEGVRVLLTHGPGEEEQAREVAAAMRRTPALGHGPTTVRQLAALFARCALWIGNDGGPKHLAVAAGTPTVSVVRATEGRVWTDDSPGSPHRCVEGEGTQRGGRGGIDAVTPERVLEVIRPALRSVPS
jgi:heptosyltransferase-3